MVKSVRNKTPQKSRSPSKSPVKGHVEATKPGAKPQNQSPEKPAKARTSFTEKVNGERITRRLTRPQGEFMGNWGTFFWTFYIPAQIYYFYGQTVMGKGEWLIPNEKFWYDLWFTLPEGIAIRPTYEAMGMIAIWIASQAFLEMCIPNKMPWSWYGVCEGVTLKSGHRLKYQMNGMAAHIITHIAFFALCYYGILDPTYVWHQMGALLTGGVITAFVFALWLYVDFGIFWKRHVGKPEFEEDWGVFSYWNFWNDFFMGVARNPRYFHNLAEVPLDLKRWWDGRTLTLWILVNFSYIAAQYYDCRFIFEFDPVNPSVMREPTCLTEGSWNNVGYASFFIAAAHAWYVFDYNLYEPAYLTTTDIRHDLFGYMLTYGMFGFLCWYYPIAFLGYLSAQGSHPAGFITQNEIAVYVGVALYLFGMLMFRLTNIQKHNFRSFIANLEAQKKSQTAIYKALETYYIWGKPVEYIHTKEGSYLLCSGFWGLARHFNYIGDLTMCVGWAIACYSSAHAFPWVPLSYCAYFWVMDIHRAFRDEDRCLKKYKSDWKSYTKQVKYRILPGVF